jgi:hypothetical protein
MNIAQEIRVLNSSVDLITSYVNYLICCFPEDRTKVVTTVLPKDITAKRYFYILLLDVVAGVNKELIPDKSDGEGVLGLLDRICQSPNLDKEERNISALKASVAEFLTWLDHSFVYDIYSANIGKQVAVSFTRKEALYLIGNRCKHSLLRSNAILTKLVKLYKDSGVEIDPGEEIQLIEDVDTWLFDDFGGYHFTKICELSSKVYWGIIQYVRPVYDKSIVKRDGRLYSFDIPVALVDDQSKFEFYELLNRVGTPFLPKIQTDKYLQDKY